jgi:hypothetical protein
VPKIHKDTIIKEVERLCELGVLERQPASEWASPSFIIPKKDRTICFLSNLREVNKKLVRKPFPTPKISTVLQELERFTFATVWNVTSLRLPLREYLVIIAKSPPNKIPTKFHLLRIFPQNFICSGLGLDSELAGNHAISLVRN